MKLNKKCCNLVNFGSCFIVHSFLLGIFLGGGEIYCYANSFCYAIVFGPKSKFKEGKSIQGSGTASRGAPPVEESQGNGYVFVYRLVCGRVNFPIMWPHTPVQTKLK